MVIKDVDFNTGIYICNTWIQSWWFCTDRWWYVWLARHSLNLYAIVVFTPVVYYIRQHSTCQLNVMSLFHCQYVTYIISMDVYILCVCVTLVVMYNYLCHLMLSCHPLCYRNCFNCNCLCHHVAIVRHLEVYD